MPKKNSVPTYRCHSSRNQAVIDVRRHDGTRTKVYLPGEFDSPESKAEYGQLVALLQAHGGRLPHRPGEQAPHDLTIDELVLRFVSQKIEVDYVHADGTPTSEQIPFRQALKPLCRLYSWSIARNFDAKTLGIVREAMVTGSWMNADEREFARRKGRKLGWSRKTIKNHIGRIRSVFRWAVLEKIVPAAVVTDLECLPPLKQGRHDVRELPPVVPVDADIVEATLPHMPPVAADMVRVQLLTGCRPGELCRMRGADLDQGGPVWLYTPSTHKTKHRGHTRTIAIGPQAQLIIRRYLKADPAVYLFSPAEQAEIIAERKRQTRKTKVQPSQLDRSKPDAKRKPGNNFTVGSYNRSIARGCRRANVRHWHAHQLRHTAALLVAREHGAEAARAVLGHRTVNMTLHYSGIDTKRASDVAASMG